MKRKRKKKCKEKGKDRARRRQGRFFIGISLFRPPFYFFASRAIPFSAAAAAQQQPRTGGSNVNGSILIGRQKITHTHTHTHTHTTKLRGSSLNEKRLARLVIASKWRPSIQRADAVLSLALQGQQRFWCVK